MTAETFAEAAMDFCSRHTFSKPPMAPRPVVDSALSAATASRPPKRSMQEMSEDEQLQAAMRASLEEKGDGANKHEFVVADDDDDDDDIECLGTKAENLKQDDDADDADNVKEELPPSFVEQLLAIPLEAEEPADGARIQLRLPDGKRVVRKFSSSASVRMIYAFVAVCLQEQGHNVLFRCSRALSNFFIVALFFDTANK
jgi:hypothetical protein